MSYRTGIYQDIPADLYHADAMTDAPALSSSGIKALLSGSPAEFMATSRRLTQWPEWARKKSTPSQDLGSVVHTLVLGRGTPYIAGSPSDHSNKDGSESKTWGSKAAAGWKAAQEAKGLIVLDRDTEEPRVQAAADSMIALLRSEYGDWPIGDSEVVVIWQRETDFGPIWCRAMIDHLALRFMTVLDPKSTDWSIDNRSLQKMAAANRWDVQAAFYLSGLPHAGVPGQFSFRFPVVEINPPYQSRFYDLPPAWLEIAEDDINRACNTFARCLRSGDWPAYERVCTEDPPEWMFREYEARRA